MAGSGHFGDPSKMTRSGEALGGRPLIQSAVMTQTATTHTNTSTLTGRRADALADRLEQGARALADFAASVTDAQWATRCMPDGRTVGVIVHHVGFVYPIEIDISRPLAKGEPLTGVTMDDVHAM